MQTFYEGVPSSTNIEQGDIFNNLPFLNLKSTTISEVIPEGNDITYKDFDLTQYVAGDEIKNVVVAADIQPGIIITQNCDLLRSDFVSFCKIRPYEDVEKENTSPKLNKRVKFLTENYAHKAKYFYLPPEMPNGFKNKMAVDFSLIHQIKLDLLRQLLSKRKCRLNSLASEHFRVKLAHYFRRFAYNPWYVLTEKNEFEIYREQKDNPKEQKLIIPYDWNLR